MSHPMYAAAKPRAIEEVPHTAYQVDYVAINCGRIIAASKRRIRFKFGYTNTEALNAGKTGQECRGSEHEVSITWSLSSGKQAIAFDQREVYFDVGETTQSKISHEFKDEFGHVIAVKIHAASMSAKANPDPDWKQYDIMIDGVSFFKMPKIYAIGIFPKDIVDTKKPLCFQNNAGPREQAEPNKEQFAYPTNNGNMGLILPDEEPKATVQEPRHEVADLLSFDEFEGVSAPAPVVTAPAPMPPAPVPQANFAQPPVAQAGYAPAQTQQNYGQGNPFEAPQPQPQAQQTQAPAYIQPSNDNFASPPVQNQSFAQPTAVPTQPAQTNHFAVNTVQNTAAPPSPPVQTNHFEAHTAPAFASQPTPITPPANSTALVPSGSSAPNYGVDVAGKNLVNLDNLFGTTTTSPATKESVNANANKSLGQLQGSMNNSGNKQPVMNPFNPAPMYQQQQAGYGYPQQQQQQTQYNNYGFQQQQYAQPAAQPGFGGY